MFYCQHCRMSRNVCRRATIEDPRLRRTLDDYQQIFQDRTRVFQNVNDAFGLRNYSYLDRIDGYNIFRQMAIDLMHDLVEGTIPDIIRKFLKKAIMFRVTTMEAINAAILGFDYGFINSKNMPGAIDFTESLGLTASQKIVLFLHFPIIFKHLTTNDVLRPYWPAVKYLVAATKICLSKTITEADLRSLDILIRSHLEEIVNVYNSNLKPKHHFMTHYVSVIREMGPPTTMWTMR